MPDPGRALIQLSLLTALRFRGIPMAIYVYASATAMTLLGRGLGHMSKGRERLSFRLLSFFLSDKKT